MKHPERTTPVTHLLLTLSVICLVFVMPHCSFVSPRAGAAPEVKATAARKNGGQHASVIIMPSVKLPRTLAPGPRTVSPRRLL